MLRVILRALWDRQVAKHGSVAALAIGAIAGVLGIPLAPEQISLLITAGSVLLYIASEVRTLWKPKGPPPVGLKLFAALVACALLGAVPRAARAETHTVSWDLPTQDVNNNPLPAGSIKSTRLQCGPGSISPVPWAVDAEILAPAASYSFDFTVNGPWNCHVWVVMIDGRQSADTPDLQFTIPFAVAAVTADPKTPANLKIK